jgi:hypothetical protein
MHLVNLQAIHITHKEIHINVTYLIIYSSFLKYITINLETQLRQLL